MHPIRSIKNHRKNRQLRKQRAIEQAVFETEVREFLAELDDHIRVFRLDPELPEILDLKANVRDIMVGQMSDFMHMWFFWINPYKDVTVMQGGELIIHERWLGHLLSPMSLVEFHLDKQRFARSCHRIVVDINGTRAYSDYGTLLVSYEAGVLNPNRFADPGNRVNNAILFVEHFTGLKLTLEEMWPLYAAEFALVDGEWIASYQTEPILAS
jgi:hypothetical protein